MPADALSYLNAARVLAPNKPQVLYEWADTLAATGDLQNSYAGFQSSLALSPQDPRMHVAMMKIAYLLEKYDQAQTEYRWLVDHSPDLLRSLQKIDPLVKKITE